jgi:hypothetical protein
VRLDADPVSLAQKKRPAVPGRPHADKAYECGALEPPTHRP